MVDLLKQAEAAYSDLQRTEQELQQLTSSKVQYQAQLNENEMVQSELRLLDDSCTVYKMMGPVLVKQDTIEATENVNKRLQFIRQEIERLTNLENKKEKELDQKKQKLLKFQEQLQAQRAAASKAS